ncbi:MAG: DUF1566 domain-containing protein [Arcobacteraceae bacterium]|nr:DUF1566 domain-containing protein [Arcobacteraceae bacterium]
MNYTRIIYSSLFIILTALFSGCGGGGGGTSEGSAGTAISGIFEDSPVSGLEYSYGSTTSITDASGKFTHDSGAAVTFNIGHAIIGTSSSSNLSGYKFPQDLAGVALADTNASKVLNIAIFLQSLDSNNNLSDGIDINSTITSCYSTGGDANLTSSTYIQIMTIAELNTTIQNCNATAIDWLTARNHLDSTMIGHGIEPLLNVPTISSITLLDSPSLNDTSITFRATFSESVSNIDISDFNTTLTGSADGIISSVSSSSGSSVDITVSSISGDGTLKLNLKTTHNLIDSHSNSLSGGYTSGSTHTLDLVAPQISSVDMPANATYSSGVSLDFTVNVDENVTVVGTPRLILDIGGTEKYADYNSSESNSTSLKFKYITETGLEDYTGIDLNSTISLISSSIKDNATNDINTTLTTSGVQAGIKIDTAPPVFQNDDTLSRCENKTDINFDINATDGSAITYSVINDLNSSEFNYLNSNQTIGSFITAPNYESTTSYQVTIKATDAAGNEANQTITISVLDKDYEDNDLYLKYVVYDNNLTSGTVSDDIAYIYFSKRVDVNESEPAALNLSSPISDYNINVAGSIINVTSSTYSNTLFDSQKIIIDTGSEFDVNGSLPDTNLSIKIYQIRDWDDDEDCRFYPTDYNQTVAIKIEYVLKTDQNDGGYEDDGDRNTNLFEDKKYSSGVTRNYSRNDTNGTVIDHIMQLMWQDDTNTTKDFNDAITYCNDLNLSNYSDWRLSSIKELSTLISYNRLDSNWISDTFINHKNKKYWSSTSNDSSPGNGWYINFDNDTSDTGGEIMHFIKSEFINVRCVRNVN